MSEQHMWEEIRDNIGHLGHFCRVESGLTSPGIPDIEYCIEGVRNNLELKHADKKARPKVRPTQVRWFRKRNRAGGRPWLFLRDDRGVTPMYYLFDCKTVPKLARLHVDEWLPLAFRTWAGKMDWHQFFGMLISRT